MKQTIIQFFKTFPTEQDCLNHLFKVRYGDGYVCPKCEKPGKWYPLAKRRAHTCQWCGHHEYPCVGTPFERSRTDLRLWFYAVYLFTTSRHGVPAKELQRQLGVTYKAAWRMAHEIRKHMAEVDGDPALSGDVEIDEAYIGGKIKGGKKRGITGRGTKKAVVFGMVERDGDVILRHVPNASRKSLLPQIDEHIKKGSTVHSDEWVAYTPLPVMGYEHRTVDHAAKQYVDGDSHVNTIEGVWSQLKRSIRGTHVHVSKQHLDKYLGEFEYRFNSRRDPELMFPELISTFAPLNEE